MPASAPARSGLSFIGVRRQALAVGATVSLLGMFLVHDLPASAVTMQKTQLLEGSQSFDMPKAGLDAAPGTAGVAASGSASGTLALTPPEDGVDPASVSRDDFSVTEFDLVQWPLPASTRISSWFGYRSCAGCTSNHQGIDFNPGAGAPIEAIADGVVVESGWGGALGERVIIEHVINGQTVRSLYAHMSSGSRAVSVGSTVTRGQVLGAVGSTGLSTGPHLHFGILIGDEPIEPYAWMQAHVNAG